MIVFLVEGGLEENCYWMLSVVGERDIDFGGLEDI